jgi:rod shape-determining protein MreD
MITRNIKYFFITIILIVLQTTMMRLLSIEGISPDILVIWIVYLAMKEGQMQATLWGFFIGLMFDFITGNFIGLSALTKTICGFSAGYFYNVNKIQLTLGSYRFLLIVSFVSLIHNIVYFTIFAQGAEIGLLRAAFQLGAITTLYTAIFTLLPMFAFARRYIE